jgi:predicted nucleotidyltransferase
MTNIFSSHSQLEKVVLYGSRAKGTFKPNSDIDITIIGSQLNLSNLQQIETELDDLLLPYKIDISIYHHITNPDLIEHIARVGKVLFVR